MDDADEGDILMLSYDMYVDDIDLYISTVIVVIVQEAIIVVVDWSAKWGLTIAVEKRTVSHIGNKESVQNCNIGETVLDSVNIRDQGYIYKYALLGTTPQIHF